MSGTPDVKPSFPTKDRFKTPGKKKGNVSGEKTNPPLLFIAKGGIVPAERVAAPAPRRAVPAMPSGKGPLLPRVPRLRRGLGPTQPLPPGLPPNQDPSHLPTAPGLLVAACCRARASGRLDAALPRGSAGPGAGAAAPRGGCTGSRGAMMPHVAAWAALPRVR